MDLKNEILGRLKALGMSQSVLAERCEVSLSTMRRVLNNPEHASLSLLRRIANVTGLRFDFVLGQCDRVHQPARPPLELQEKQAVEKATQIVSEVQGTSALENQGVTVTAFQDMVRKTVHELMAGSRRRLWA